MKKKLFKEMDIENVKLDIKSEEVDIEKTKADMERALTLFAKLPKTNLRTALVQLTFILK